MGTEEEIPKPTFKISAAVVKQLGEELVSDEVTALMELVKNSYDADAKYIIIDINTKESYSGTDTLFAQEGGVSKKIGYVRLLDNGFGMTHSEVFKNWLTISMSDKRAAKKTGFLTEEGRTFLGEKGVGRLSTQRIGDKIDLITQSPVTKEKTHIAFDWQDFKEDVTLDSIKILESHSIVEQVKKGTQILIQDLKDTSLWDGNSFDRIKGQLSQLISPTSHQGFKVFLKHNGNSIDLQDLNSEIRDLAISSFKFTVDGDTINIEGSVSFRKLMGNKKSDLEYFNRLIEPDNGKNFFDFLSNQELNKSEYLPDISYSGEKSLLFTYTQPMSISKIPNITKIINVVDSEQKANIDSTREVEMMVAYPGNFDGAIYEFRLDRHLVTDTLNNEGSIKEIIKNQTGVRIFRDGFGIKPYGLETNDWLRLGGGSTSGGSIYSLRPKNVVGHVSLSARGNSNLKEKTDREGFVESPYTHNFFLIMQTIRDSINLVLEKTRRSYLKYKEYVGKENLGIQDISDSFSNINEVALKARDIKEQTEKLIIQYSRVADKIKVIESENPKLKDESNAYAEIISEIKSLLDDSREMFGKITSLVASTENLDNFVLYLQPLMESLENQLIEFTSLASLGITSEALSHELSNIIDKLAEETSKAISKSQNRLSKDLEFIKIYYEKVNTSIISFRKQLSHLDPSLKYTREKKELMNVGSILHDIKDYFEERFNGEISINIVGEYGDFNIYGNKGKLFQVFDNLFLNSEYWLKEKSKAFPGFKPVIQISIESPLIKFSDNGFGIDPSVENTLFQPFVTKKLNNAGRGLGLFIVMQLLDSMGCTVNLLPLRNDQSRRYAFQINLNPIIKR